MENSPKENENEKASDIETALFLIGHINNPCVDQSGNNIREFYIKEAVRIMKTFTNPEAKKLLEDAINQYAK